MIKNRADSNYRNGTLPSVAPLAMSYTPMQMSAEPNYEASEALSRGTLFPGLDLPFMNIVNPDVEMNPLTELMAIDFVAHDLQLYLDTHENDKEAFEMYQTFLALCKEARERYVKMCGPVMHKDMLGMAKFEWLDAPWPWQYKGREG